MVKASFQSSATHFLPRGKFVGNASPDDLLPKSRKAMHSHLDPKTIAKALRAALQERQIVISHRTALEIVAAQHRSQRMRQGDLSRWLARLNR
jgi:DNA-binding transcriptional regulator YhcF (GntR family)